MDHLYLYLRFLLESLILDTFPANSPRFEPECTELCRYCLSLRQMLAGQGFYSEMEKHLSCLLYELINYFAAEMKAPRCLRTADNVKFIDEVAASCDGTGIMPTLSPG